MPLSSSNTYCESVGELRSILEQFSDETPIYIHYEKNYEDRFIVALEIDNAVLLVPVEKLKDLSENQNLIFQKISL